MLRPDEESSGWQSDVSSMAGSPRAPERSPQPSALSKAEPRGQSGLASSSTPAQLVAGNVVKPTADVAQAVATGVNSDIAIPTEAEINKLAAAVVKAEIMGVRNILR